MEPHYFNIDLIWNKDRKGKISSPELQDEFEVATPPPFPKGIEWIWSPEHLFTAAVSSCFMTTFLAIAENSKLEYVSFSCPAKGKLEQIDGKFLMTEVLLEPVLTILKEEDKERAERILQKAEKACLITNSIKAETRMISKIIINQEITI
jgi:peroxiredoxin-like protein